MAYKNDYERKSTIKEAEKRGYTPNSSGTAMQNGSSTLKFTNSGGSLISNNGERWTSSSDFRNSTK